MSKVVYLWGAGASRGKRTTDNPNHANIELEESDIIEGLPLVYEIPKRLDYVMNQIKEFKPSTNSNDTVQLENSLFPLCSDKNGGTGFDTARDLLLEDLQWLKEKSTDHATIDTFAKKLYLTNKTEKFYKVEMLLSIFFIIEQIINKPDGRYDTFLASILDRNLRIPDDITILTWNYDSQINIAYEGYRSQGETLSVCELKDDKSSYEEKRYEIFKINGTANFLKPLPITKKIDDEVIKTILDNYIKNGKSPNGTRLSFAWDNSPKNSLARYMENAIKDAETLIVIGYTFPFFNREEDRTIFQNMENLKKIYIQDPKADYVKQNILPVLSEKNRVQKLYENITIITNTDQFFLPPEL